MANKRFWLGMLVMVFVFCVPVLSYAGSEKELNGTWDSGDAWGYRFNNGTVEYLEGGDLGYVDDSGTFTTNGNILTMSFDDYTLVFLYSVSKNELTLTYEDGSTQILSKK